MPEPGGPWGTCWAYVIGLGVNEKVQYTGEPIDAQFFVGVDFIVFPDFFFQILSHPPPISLTRALLFF